MRNLSICPLGGFVVPKRGADIVDDDFGRGHTHPDIPGTAKHHPVTITVFGCRTGRPTIAGVTWLGHFLINDPIKLLPGVQVVVAMKNDVHGVL